MNENCLKGIACPKCKSEGPFGITGTAVFTVTDEGTEDYGDVEWGDGSLSRCLNCGHESVLRFFTVEHQKKHQRRKP